MNYKKEKNAAAFSVNLNPVVGQWPVYIALASWLRHVGPNEISYILHSVLFKVIDEDMPRWYVTSIRRIGGTSVHTTAGAAIEAATRASV
jgi:hypothetical protein